MWLKLTRDLSCFHYTSFAHMPPSFQGSYTTMHCNPRVETSGFTQSLHPLTKLKPSQQELQKIRKQIKVSTGAWMVEETAIISSWHQTGTHGRLFQWLRSICFLKLPGLVRCDETVRSVFYHVLTQSLKLSLKYV